MTTIDFANYVRPPRINAISGFVLGVRILRAAPKDASPVELSALTTLRSAAKAVQDSVQDRHRPNGSDLRLVDQQFDGAWAGLYGRLVACTRLIGRPEAARAEALLANLFPAKLVFVTWGHEAEWFHSRMLLQRIHSEDLYDDVIELAGGLFMTCVEQAHKALGDGLGLDEEGEPEPNPGLGLGECVAALAEAIARYGRILSGSVDLEDVASRTRFLSAVAPIDAHRARHRRAGSGEQPSQSEASDEDLDIDSELPPVNPGP